MKITKFIFITILGAILIIISIYLLSEKDTVVTKNDLPKYAQNFINKYFNTYTISYIKKDREFLSVDYEVIFSNSMEIKFDSNGNWKEVDGNYFVIPTSFIPEKITSSINNQFPNADILKIKKKRRKYEVKVSTGLELIFNPDSELVKIKE